MGKSRWWRRNFCLFRRFGKKDALALIPHAIRAVHDTVYTYTAQKTKDNKENTQEIVFITEYANDNAFQVAFTQAVALADAMKFAKDLANAPANICTPEFWQRKPLIVPKKQGQRWKFTYLPKSKN